MVQGLLQGRIKLFLTVGAANLLALATGMMLAWSSPVLQKLKSTGDDNPLSQPISNSEGSWIGGLLSVGAAIGPFPFGFLQDKIGRKWTLLLIAVPYVVAYLMSAFAKDVSLFLVLRALAGLSVGGLFTVAPTYIAELSDSSVRGMLGSSINNFLCLGLILTYALGAYLPLMWYSIISAIVPVAFIVIFFLLCPDSPYYLMRTSRSEAEKVLAFLRSKPAIDVQSELKEIETVVEEAKANSGTILDIFKSKGTIKALIISVMLCAFQQLSGINVVLFYAQDIFEQSGTNMDSAIPPIIIGAVQLGSSFITPIVVDRWGRKILFLISAAGMTIAEIPLGVYFYLKANGNDVDSISMLPIITLVIYIIAYNTAFGPLPWTVMSELFPSNIKSAAASLTAASCWFTSFLLTFFFDSISAAIGTGPSFWLFAGFSALAFLFTIFYVPETKGKSFQEIQDELNS